MLETTEVEIGEKKGSPGDYLKNFNPEVDGIHPGAKPKNCRNSDASTQRVAIMEALGTKPKDIQKVIPGTMQTVYNKRQKAYKEGYVQELQGKMVKSATALLEERKILAERCFKIVNKTADLIGEKLETSKKINLKEAEFCLKAIGETEHSGRKVDAPKVVINIKRNATLNIQQNMQDIGDILSRSGIDLDGLVPV